MPTLESTVSNAYLAASPVAGKGLFAFTKRDEGDLIFTLEPKATAVKLDRLRTTCANCFATASGDGAIIGNVYGDVEMTLCTKCRHASYCSKHCEQQHWDKIHKKDCRAIADMGSPHGVPETMRLVLSVINLSTNSENKPFNDLSAPLDKVLEQDDERVAMVDGGSRIVDRVARPSPGLSAVRQQFARVFVNSATMSHALFEPVGVFMDPTVARINHSCDPNAFVVFDGVHLSLRALRAINKGEEIFISYTNETHPYYRRQRELATTWFFDCRCTKCQKGPTLAEDQFSSNTGALPKNFEKRTIVSMSDMAEQVPETDIDYVGEDFRNQLLSKTQAYGFATLEDVQKVKDPEEALNFLREGLNGCLQTNSWPDHRAPLPDIYRALFNYYLRAEKWAWAFVIGAKLWTVVHPKIYPQTFHPLRVQHRASMLKLSQMLMRTSAINFEHIQPDTQIEFAWVATVLLCQLWKDTDKSHGPSSALRHEVDTMVVQARQDFAERSPAIFGRAKDFEAFSNAEFFAIVREQLREEIAVLKVVFAGLLALYDKNNVVVDY